MVDSVRLRVEGAEKRDAGRGVARLPERARRDLGVLSGDSVVIEGRSRTVAKVWPGDAEDDALRIDADTRANADATVGDTVTVRRASVAEAGRVTLELPVAATAETSEAVRAALRDRPLRAGDRVRFPRLDARGRVVATEPDGLVRVTDATTIDVRAGDAGGGTHEATDDAAPTAGGGVAGTAGEADAADRPGETTYEDIGGLDEELDLVRETVELPLAEPELFRRLGIDPPRGVLLYGPPGTGKTLIARAVANEVDAHFRTISGPEIVSKYKGESEQRLREAFEEAADNAPAIVFIDEIDAIAGERDEDADMENRVVAQLLTLLDGLEERGQVVVVGATNRVDTIDPALRRGGRFDREIEIGPPSEAGRREILDVHTRGMPLADDVDLDGLAGRTHGFVGADLASLAKEAGMTALRDWVSRRDADGRTEGPTDAGAEPDLAVAREDFERALAAVEPSAMREYVAEAPEVTFEDVGGLADAKRVLRESVEWPLTYAPLFEAARADPPSGILLYGPPGTGKTLLARALAGETDVNFLTVAGPELLDRYVGESEKAVREIFDRARQAAPSILFFDEVDAISGGRGEGSEVSERVVSQLLTELDGLAANPNVVVLAATNRRGAIDDALLRPGRLERHVEVPDPDEAGRREILAVHTREKPLADGVDLDAMAAETADRSGAQLEALVREASMRAIREIAAGTDPETANARAGELRITRDHFEAAMAELDEAS